MSERREHYEEILVTGARQTGERERIDELAAGYDAFDRLVRPST